MKHAKNLTRSMKNKLTKLELNPDNWHYIKSLPGELIIVHKVSGEVRYIYD